MVHRQRNSYPKEKEVWGANVIGRLSSDLIAAFPQMRGFSPRNLGYMKAFAQTCTDEAFLQQVAAKMPWFHHCVLLDKVKGDQERVWYMQQAIEHGWSRNILEVQIKTNLFQRKGNALTNFKNTLPALQSDLAHEASSQDVRGRLLPRMLLGCSFLMAPRAPVDAALTHPC